MTHVSRDSHLNHETERRLSTKPNCGVTLGWTTWFYLGITLNSSSVEAASQVAVTAVLFVRTDGEHQNATAADATCFGSEGCFVSREWSEALARLDISPDPQMDKHIINLGMW